ncbi:MAG TPA: sigma-70 family RNA polymerase sigma factor [Thermoanaerobaculia bacterium]
MRQPSDNLPAGRVEEEDPRGGDRLVEQWRRSQGAERDETFRQIYLLFYRKAYRFFVRRGFPGDEAKDLTQDTFLRLHQNLASFRGEARFETWLFKIAANIYKNRLRSGSTLKREGQEVAWEDVAEGELTAAPAEVCKARSAEKGPLDQVLTEERAERLHAAVADLPPQMRRCVMMRVTGDMKYREIADVLQVSVDTVKAHLYQARQQLKGRLGDYFDDLSV